VEPVETAVDRLYGFMCVMMSTAMPVDCFRLFCMLLLGIIYFLSKVGIVPHASLHRCNACTQGLLHTKTVDASEPRGLLRSIYPQLSRLKVHPKVQNLFNRCQVVLVAKITSPASSSAPARILDEAFVLRNRGF
jgi:hypothetical protein